MNITKLPSTKIHFPNFQNCNVGCIRENPATVLPNINYTKNRIQAKLKELTIKHKDPEKAED